MINIPPIKPSTSIQTELISNVSKTWRVGQVLNATTQRGGEALSKVLIKLGEHTLEAKTPVKLETGQEIKLLVKAAGENNLTKLPLLSILPADTPLEKSQIASFKLRQFITLQTSFSTTQQNVQLLLANKQATNLLPKELVAQLAKLQNSLQLRPDQGVTSPQQLKQLVENSGIFLESKLKTATDHKLLTENVISNDFKNILLKTSSLLSKINATSQQYLADNVKITPEVKNLIQQIILNSSGKPATLVDSLISNLPRPLLHQVVVLLNGANSNPPATSQAQMIADMVLQNLHNTITPQQKLNEISTLLHTKLLLLDLAQQIDRSLSQITSLQLQPLSREVDTLTLLLFNLIMKDKEESTDINFKFEQESETSETDSWRITVIFNFRTLGKIQSSIHLKDRQVSTIFQCEKESTSNAICKNKLLLENKLQQAGFETVGTLVKTSPLQENLIVHTQTHLLDENV